MLQISFQFPAWDKVMDGAVEKMRVVCVHVIVRAFLWVPVYTGVYIHISV